MTTKLQSSEHIVPNSEVYVPRTFAFKDITVDEMVHEKVAHILDCDNAIVEYQPIINTQDDSIYAYEALARFNIDGIKYNPEYIFECCMGSGQILFLLEFMLKTCQISQRPKGKTLFLNMDARAFASEVHRKYWTELFKNEKDIVIEIIENDGNKSHMETDLLIDFLKKQKIRYALDDFFQEHTLFSSRILNDAPIIKIDKGFFYHTREEEAYSEFFRGFVSFCRMRNKSLIVEGIETQEDLVRAKELGITYVQGFYFKDRFIER